MTIIFPDHCPYFPIISLTFGSTFFYSTNFLLLDQQATTGWHFQLGSHHLRWEPENDHLRWESAPFAWGGVELSGNKTRKFLGQRWEFQKKQGRFIGLAWFGVKSLSWWSFHVFSDSAFLFLIVLLFCLCCKFNSFFVNGSVFVDELDVGIEIHCFLLVSVKPYSYARFVCLFVCLLVCLFACLLVCLFVWLLVCFFASLFLCSFVFVCIWIHVFSCCVVQSCDVFHCIIILNWTVR